MSKHSILFIPDPRLREKTQLVRNFGPELQTLLDEMFEIMYAADGVGLAATQIGIPLRVAVIDVSRGRDEPRVLVNPQVCERRNPLEMQEGCLSVPGHVDKVVRADWVRMQALDRDGQSYEIEADGLLAECIQHEVDHLHGKLYIDYFSQLRQKFILKKVQRFIKKNR